MNKSRSSTKIAIAFVLVAAAVYFGYGFVSGWMINRKHFEPIPPGVVNIVGVDTSAGYYVVVANGIAKLVRGETTDFAAGDPTERSEGEQKRVPIRELLQSLQGNEKALGKLVMTLNDISDAEFPAYPVVWKAEDIRSALEGNEELARKLEKDLNVRLDGTPVEQIKIGTLEGGIVIDSPVELSIKVGAEPKMLTARIQELFHPQMPREVWAQVREKPNLTSAVIMGHYIEEGRRVLENPKERQDVKAALSGRIDKARLQSLAEIPKRMLDSARVIVNDSLIDKAEYRTNKTSDGKAMHDLVLGLTDEGRQRLWQYSKRNPNAQLLVTWEGIAIAAPKIVGELAFSEVVVKQIPEEDLARETVDAIQQKKKEASL